MSVGPMDTTRSYDAPMKRERLNAARSRRWTGCSLVAWPRTLAQPHRSHGTLAIELPG
jgi:hypothetical protein